MPPKAAPRTDFTRQNRQQIKEQEAINRERVRQDEHAVERQRQVAARQRSQYEHGPRVNMSGHVAPGGGPAHAPAARGAAAGREPQEMPSTSTSEDVRIDVFVRECDDDAATFGGLESALIQAAAARRGGGAQPSPSRYDVADDEPPAPAPARAAPRAAAPSGRAPVGSYSTGRAPESQPSSGRAPPAGAGAPALGLRQLRPSSQNRPSSTGTGASTAAPSAAAAGRGQVPDYLKQRKAELAAEKAETRRIAELKAEQSKYPPGHRPVSEEERDEILARLSQRKVELEADLGRLPMRFDTQAVRQRRQQIEAELMEVEAAERKFSVKKQLYVPI